MVTLADGCPNIGGRNFRFQPKCSTKIDFDFAVELNGDRCVFEVEKANKEKILYDFLKMHVYLDSDVTAAVLIAPINWPHTATAILGSLEFIAAIEEKYLINKEPDRNLPELRKITKRLSLEAIIKEAGSCFGENEQLAAKASIYISHKYSGARLKEIGERFGIGESAVSQASKRFAEKMAKDAELRNLVGKLHAKLRNVNV